MRIVWILVFISVITTCLKRIPRVVAFIFKRISALVERHQLEVQIRLLRIASDEGRWLFLNHIRVPSQEMILSIKSCDFLTWRKKGPCRRYRSITHRLQTPSLFNRCIYSCWDLKNATIFKFDILVYQYADGWLTVFEGCWDLLKHDLNEALDFLMDETESHLVCIAL